MVVWDAQAVRPRQGRTGGNVHVIPAQSGTQRGSGVGIGLPRRKIVGMSRLCPYLGSILRSRLRGNDRDETHSPRMRTRFSFDAVDFQSRNLTVTDTTVRPNDRHTIYNVLVVLLSYVAWHAACHSPGSATESECRKPNVVVILTDDKY